MNHTAILVDQEEDTPAAPREGNCFTTFGLADLLKHKANCKMILNSFEAPSKLQNDSRTVLYAKTQCIWLSYSYAKQTTA